ncbi:MAG TPA: hypothetical protein VFS60_15215 [Thermoanaerobaculia bacterium]|nr:hypothetical protein [Thermoanaerobaculia bacterium]
MKRAVVVCSVLALTLVAGLACKKKEPAPPPPPPIALAPAETAVPTPAVPTVASVTLGTAVGADKRVTAPVEVFVPSDTIYASVETTGAGPATLRAHWSFVRGDQTATVDDTTIQIAGPGVSEFHVAKPSGWPPGDYKVEIFLGDQAAPAVTKSFHVG